MGDQTWEAFSARAERNAETGCLLWREGVLVKGYGRVRFAGRPQFAHRVAYELAVGPILDGLVLDHLCRVRSCIEPTHLEPVTNRENLARGEGINAASIASFPSGRCGRGHVVIDQNRQCLECHTETTRVRRPGREPHPLADCPWCGRRIAYYPTTRTMRHHGRGCPGSAQPIEATKETDR